MAAFPQQWQGLTTCDRGRMWPTKSKMFTVRSFTEKVCQSLSQKIHGDFGVLLPGAQSTLDLYLKHVLNIFFHSSSVFHKIFFQKKD